MHKTRDLKFGKRLAGMRKEKNLSQADGDVGCRFGGSLMLDADLAELYGVETFNLNKAVKRNIDRFPSDFMFQATKDEVESLRFQLGISKTSGRGGRRYLPYAFTEQGVAMLSSILK